MQILTHILAQTTQPSGGFRTWGPAEWLSFFVGAGGLIAGIAAAVNSVVANWRAGTANNTAIGAASTSAINTANIQHVSERIDSANAIAGEAKGVAASASETATAAAVAVQGTGDGTSSPAK